MKDESNAATRSRQEDLYQEAASVYGVALDRLARAYEADRDIRRDLLQEIHIALWRSFELFNGRCSLRTWVYRVAHNVATSHVIRSRRSKAATFTGLEEIEAMPDQREMERAAGERDALGRLVRLVQQLKPLDRQVIVSYLEGLDAASIAEITGLSPANVATRIHRIKSILARRFHGREGGAT